MQKSKSRMLSVLLSIVLMCVAFPSHVQAQNNQTGKKDLVTLDMKSATVTQVFRQIKEQTGYHFVINSDLASSLPKVNVQVKDKSVPEVLDIVLANLDCAYEINGNMITVYKKSVPRTVTSVPANAANQAGRRVALRGVVSDDSGNPLPGATIKVDGGTEITVSDADGNYTLYVDANEKRSIIYSFIGMEDKKVRYNGQRVQDVRLRDDSHVLGEVEVFGNGIFKRRTESFTGSAATYNQEDLKSVGNANILKSLADLDPSFILEDNVLNGSDPNALNDITIRGNASFAGLQGEYSGNPNTPLFIIDGFESSQQQVFDLDINRVENVTILKDAAAKAIYGAKAANGVVVIETKQPEAGRIRLTYTGDLNVTAPDLSSYDLTNAEEKLLVEKNAGRYDSSSPSYAQSYREQYNEIQKNISRGVDTYWLAKPLRTGIGHKHTAYLEGGDDRMRYSGTVSYNGVTGVMKGSDRRTVSGNIQLSYRYKTLLFRNSLSVTSNRADNSPYGSFSSYSSANPYYSPYDENGNIVKILGYYQVPSVGGARTTYYNPLYNATIGTKDFSKYNEYTENFYIEWRPTKQWTFLGRFGYTHQDNQSDVFYPGDHTRFTEWTGDRYFQRGSYSITNGNSENISADIAGTYTGRWDKHLLIANAAWSMNSSSSYSHGMEAWGFLNNHVDYINFAKQYAENGRPSGSEAKTRSLGITGTANYSYDERYLFDFSVRYNGSSIFGSNNRWGTFWSAGLGWNIHNEKFVKDNMRWINQFKIRGSYGLTGSQNFSPYQALATYQFYDNIVYDNIVGAYLMAVNNDNLKWQQTADLNIGADIRLFNSLSLRVDVYNSTTKDALLAMTLPTSTGFNSYQENLGNIVNKGFDASASWRFFHKGHNYMSLNGSVSHNTNKVKEINDALRSFNETQDASGVTTPIIRYEEGQSMSVIWAVKSLGIDPATGSEIFVKKDGTTTYNYSTDDYIVAGDSNPKWRGNFGLSGEYEGIGLNISFRYRLGGDVYNQTLVDRVENVNVANNVDRRVLKDTWHQVGDVATFKRIRSTPSTTYATTRFVERDNILEFASLSAYYDFKYQSWLSKLKMERLRVQFYMNDIFHLSTVKQERGLSYPYARSFSFSISATF